MSPTVLVVGGYGAVGAPLCRDLASHGVHLAIGGRSPEKAAPLAAELGADVRLIDIGAPPTWADAVCGIDLVVICIDLPGPDFPAFLLAHGIHYADITASDALFRQIEALPRPDRSSALLSVGLAPGLTNILAVRAATGFEQVGRIDIGMLFGLGDSHGEAGLDWMAEQIFNPARHRGGERLDFGPPWGGRTAHFVDFSDQHALARSLPRTLVSTRVAFDSRLATWALFGAASLFPNSKLVKAAARKSFGALRAGSATVNLSVHVRGWRDGRREAVAARFLGEHESTTTARLASLMLRRFMAGPMRPGIWHSHTRLDPDDILDAVAREGIGRIESMAPQPDAVPEQDAMAA